MARHGADAPSNHRGKTAWGERMEWPASYFDFELIAMERKRL